MKVLLLFVGYIFFFLGFAAAVVPGLYPWIFEPIGLKPETSLYRFAMLAALIGLPFFLRTLSLNSWVAAGYTLSRREAWSTLVKGLVIGIMVMVGLTGLQWLLDIRHFAPPPDRWTLYYLIRTLITGLLSGLAVGFIEETFFRGLVHTGMRRSLSFWPTALLSAAYYAALHFVKPSARGNAEFDVGEALQMIYSGLARVGDLAPIHDSFVTLFVVGIFLSMVRERTGNILWVIGIHAGWVMIIKATKYLTDVTSIEGNTSAWIGTYDSLTGWMATLWLAAISLWYWFRRQPAKL